MQISEPQKLAIEQIKELTNWMMNTLHVKREDCWFTQKSLYRVTYHTLQALKAKGFLEDVPRARGDYYRWTGQDVE